MSVNPAAPHAAPRPVPASPAIPGELAGGRRRSLHGSSASATGSHSSRTCFVAGDACRREPTSRCSSWPSRACEGCRYAGCDFSRALFADVAFSGCDFSNADFSEANFTRCTFASCKFTGANFSECRACAGWRLGDSTFAYASLAKAQARTTSRRAPPTARMPTSPKRASSASRSTTCASRARASSAPRSPAST